MKTDVAITRLVYSDNIGTHENCVQLYRISWNKMSCKLEQRMGKGYCERQHPMNGDAASIIVPCGC